MATVKHSPVIPLSEFSKKLQYLFDNGMFEEAKKLMKLEPVVFDDGPVGHPPMPPQATPMPPYIRDDIDGSSGLPTLRISVDQMVRNMVGDGYLFKVVRENWDDGFHYGQPPFERDQIAIHLMQKADNPNCEVITIRERTDQFPSPELRAKLELMRR